ncbi:hypothetical protein WT72_24300 [Burkholderia pseudomultivorans]|uniref:hypothetical protein n=1 Tax=Burkholderia pseudomultivorans TaxID=1207504 RepID=UPI0007592DA0|nr:hypothetical protein [Burkholderia pseudomultivorans]KWI50296.1 hypothetical protein WT72_24300 [Burkholderia pseudomultivorans]
MVWYAGLLDKGLTLAGDFLSYLREGDARSHEVTVAAAAASSEANAKLASAVDDVAKKLDGAVQSIVGNIVNKLERDQLELLAAQVKSVHFALEFENDGMLAPTVVRITELIAYAKNRIAEGKREWLGPWLMGESIRIIALRRLASSEKALALVQSEAHAFRLSILDYGGQSLMNQGKVPWVQIAEFVQGANEDVVHLIAQSVVLDVPKQRAKKVPGAVAAKQVKEREVTKEDASTASIAPSSSVKTPLNPANAWPFPTGSKP